MVSGFFGPISRGGASEPAFQGPMLRISLSDTLPPEPLNIIEPDLIALIDTGSDICGIDSALVKKHGLITRGKTPAISTAGQTSVEMCEVRIILQDGQALRMVCRVVSIREVSAEFDFLFGMDAIRFFRLSVAKPLNEVTLQLL